MQDVLPLSSFAEGGIAVVVGAGGIGSALANRIAASGRFDGVVLTTGCDKTTPGQLMGAASVDLPTIVVSSGPMLNGKYRGQDIGSGTDVWKFSEAVRAGEMTLQDFMAAESGMSRSAGVCMTMGTASTMNAMAEALGMTDARKDYVYLSDGGHFENLGLYELVRRRCRLVLVPDAVRRPGVGRRYSCSRMTSGTRTTSS